MAADSMPPLSSRKKRPSATTPEAKENQMIALAFDAAEKQMREGTASAQVVTHFLKLGSSRERLEQEKLKQDTILQVAKVETMAAQERTEELYKEALSAMSRYQGRDELGDD